MENIRGILSDWYAQNGRRLPWRETTDPYQIWVSEIILQQTRVNQGMDYFLRFVNRFPDVASLAAADEDDVMRYWQGLGYYSRARNLQAAARQVMQNGGIFPQTYDEVRALKGVGDYTAAAICSFAYNLPYAVVDGNVYRILSRLLGIDTPIDTTAGKRQFAQLADALLDPLHPGRHNQAMMDFGAVQCLPRNPRCEECPLVVLCEANLTGRVSMLPVKQHRTRTTDRYFNYMFARAGEFVFLHKRSGNDIWRNLYEFPLVESDTELTEEQFYAHPDLRSLITPGEEPVFRCIQRGGRQVLSHRIIHANFYEVILPSDAKSFGDYLCVPISEIGNYPVHRMIERFLQQYL